MPIEIKELHIKVAVNTRDAKPDAPQKGASEREGAGGNDAIVAECVEQVLELIKQKKER